MIKFTNQGPFQSLTLCRVKYYSTNATINEQFTSMVSKIFIFLMFLETDIYMFWSNDLKYRYTMNKKEIVRYISEDKIVPRSIISLRFVVPHYITST